MQASERKKDFGAAVRSERTRLKLSQEDLAERANLHRTYITDIERGARNLSLETICKLATALGLTIEALFSRAEVRQQTEQLEQLTGGPGNLVDVLLVEDDPRDVELTLAAFKQSRLTNRVLVVRDGAAALDFVFCRRQYAHRRIESNPQILLLDLNLPKVHGLEVLRRIKADSQTRHIRVVVLTASRKDEYINKALELGAEAYLIKPVNFQSFSKVTPQLSCQWALLGTTREARA
jgi:CheY-like chemotaxis protein/DNA-binding XRE family transcriptional regulator